LVYELAVRLVRYFEFRAAWSEWQDTYELALKATRNSGDRLREAMILLMLGSGCRRQCRWADAIERYGASRKISQGVGNRALEAATLNSMAMTYDDQGRWDEALGNYGKRARHLSRARESLWRGDGPP